MASAVPVELVLQNFGSHKNTRIPLAKAGERCFITGNSGSGKSHILDAMQYVLGRKIQNDNDFFHYEQPIVDGTKEKVYADVAKIELKFLNQGPDYLYKYPKDQFITLGLQAFYGNRRKDRRYIKLPDGTEHPVTYDELKQFGDWEDPLVFIDDQQTHLWTTTSARERYEKVARFIGIESYRESVKQARDEFDKAQANFDSAEADIEKAKIIFASIEEKYKRFEQKRAILADIEALKGTIAHARVFDSYEKYKAAEKEFYEKIEARRAAMTERESLRGKINKDTERKEEIVKSIETVRKKKELTNANLEEITFQIKKHDEGKKQVIAALDERSLGKPSLDDKDRLKKEAESTEEAIEELRTRSSPIAKSLREKEEQLAAREGNKVPLPKDVVRLRKELESAGIPCELLFETLEFKPGAGEWIDYIETLLAESKYAIVVDEENREKAEAVNRAMQSDATLIYPRREYVRTPDPTLRNWMSLLDVQTSSVRKDTVIMAMNMMLSGTYFATDPVEKERYFKRIPAARVICLDKYMYLIYMQRKFLKRVPEYVIGKGAKQKEIERLREEIARLKDEQSAIKREIDEQRRALDNIRVEEQYIEFLAKEGEIGTARVREAALRKELDELNMALANPEGQIASLESQIEQAKRERKRQEETIQVIEAELKKLQDTLTLNTKDFDLNMLEWVKMQQQPVVVGTFSLSLNELHLFMEVREAEFVFLGIIKDVDTIIAQMSRPTFHVDELQHELAKHEAALQGYADVDETIVQKYTESKKQLATLQDLLAKHQQEVRECEGKFNTAVDNLVAALVKWQQIVSKKFQAIMNGLQLDGKLEFNEDPKKPGEYELNLIVANSIGGSLDKIEETRFSKGERLRVSITFEMAILTQSRSAFFVWDEFDQNIGDIHREMLADVIAQFLPDRKLIAISPNNLIKGYVRIFPQFNTIWKNDDQCSEVSITRPEEEARKRGDLLDVIAEAKK
ncbi:MAG: ATP-binding protein [Candidatus Sigynarchaeota archaeon]